VFSLGVVLSGRNKNSATIYDVASHAGVSITTVSRFLNNPESVKIETGKKIACAVESLDYIPKGNAGSRAKRSIGRIGVLSPYFPAPSFVDRVQGMVPVFHESNYEMVIYAVDGPEQLEEYLSSVPFSRRLDGLILMAVQLTAAQYKKLEAMKLHVVMIETDDSHFSRVLPDDYHGGQLAAELFLKKNYFPCLYMGDKYSGAEYRLHPSTVRQEGFFFELERCDRQVEWVLESYATVEDARDEFLSFLENNPPPRAVFAMSDIQAIGVIKALKEKNILIPDETAVLGFDDIRPASWMDLSTINQNLEESGRIAARLLIDQIKANKKTIQKVNLQVELLERSTT